MIIYSSCEPSAKVFHQCRTVIWLKLSQQTNHGYVQATHFTVNIFSQKNMSLQLQHPDNAFFLKKNVSAKSQLNFNLIQVFNYTKFSYFTHNVHNSFLLQPKLLFVTLDIST